MSRVIFVLFGLVFSLPVSAALTNFVEFTSICSNYVGICHSTKGAQDAYNSLFQRCKITDNGLLRGVTTIDAKPQFGNELPWDIALDIISEEIDVIDPADGHIICLTVYDTVWRFIDVINFDITALANVGNAGQCKTTGGGGNQQN